MDDVGLMVLILVLTLVGTILATVSLVPTETPPAGGRTLPLGVLLIGIALVLFFSRGLI